MSQPTIRAFRPMLLLAFSLLLSACNTNPVTGKQEFTGMSPQQEVAYGEQNYLPAQQSQGGAYSVEPALNDYVASVGMRLAPHCGRPGLPYEFVVLNNGVPNAWALPGGKIAINRGLLLALDDESQLAAVLSHEIIHAAARHGAQASTRGTLLGIGTELLSMAAGEDYSELTRQGLGLGAAAVQSRYGREQELEADLYGTRCMAAAGYDAQGAVELQAKLMAFAQGQNPSWLQGLFASHPPSQERLERNRSTAAGLPGGQRNVQAWKSHTQILKKDAQAYQAYEEGLKAYGSQQFASTLKQANAAISVEAREGLFWELKAMALAGQNEHSQALAAMKKAAQLSPRFYRTRLQYGLMLVKKENNQQAEAELKASYDLLPTMTSAYHLGYLAEGRRDYNSARRYYQQVAAGSGELSEAAKQRLAQLPSGP